jgi:hypothetical protein
MAPDINPIIALHPCTAGLSTMSWKASAHRVEVGAGCAKAGLDGTRVAGDAFLQATTRRLELQQTMLDVACCVKRDHCGVQPVVTCQCLVAEEDMMPSETRVSGKETA